MELHWHDHPLDGTPLVVQAGLGWSRHTCIPKDFMYFRDHFISKILSLDWKLFSFVLRAAIAYRYCTIKSHNGKSRRRRYKFQKSLQYEFVTSHCHLLRLHSRLHPWYPQQGRIHPVSLRGGGDFSNIWQSSLITGSLHKRDEVYVTTLLWQNNGRQNGLISRLLFSELYKIMVKRVTFVGFRGGDPPNRPPPLDPPLIHDASGQRDAAEQIAADRLPVFQR